MNNAKKGLGKGLATLLGEASKNLNEKNSEFRYLKLENVMPNKDQPRKNIPQDSLEELALSIKVNGVIQPIVVQSIEDDKYQIVAGERRWRAAQLANLKEIPALVKKYTQAQEFEVALIENIQRQNLNPIEEAQGYLRLIEEFKYKQEDLANLLGKSRSYIANILRLNSLPDFAKQAVIARKISAGHAKNLVGITNDLAKQFLNIIISKELSVRQTELLVQRNKKAQTSLKLKPESAKSDYMELAEMLSNKLGAKVQFASQGLGGQIRILFTDMIELDSILTKIG